MKKFILLVVAALLCVATTIDAVAQRRDKATDTNLVGHVIDARTREHIAYATIAVRGATLGAATNEGGHYMLIDVPSDTELTIVASSVGYDPVEKVVKLVAGKTLELNFELRESSVEMEQVVVSANRQESNRKEAPTIVGIVASELFDRTSSANIAEALNFQPGMRVEYSCSNCGFPQLRINGLEGQYTQILLDSRPIFSSLAGVYGLEQLPAGMIERVEVVRGGGSALFGSNAIAGVVNIITKEPQRNLLSLSNTTGVMEGGLTDISTSLNAAYVSDDYRAGAYVFGMIRDRDAYDRNGDGFSEIPTINSETIGFRTYYKTSAYSKLTAEYHHIREYRRGGDKLDIPPHEAEIAEKTRHGINGGGLRFDLFSKDYRHKLNIYTSFQGIRRSSYYGAGKDPNAYGHTIDNTLVAGAQYAYSFRKLLFLPSQLTAGVELNNTNLIDHMTGYDRHIKQLSQTIGGYVQNEWQSEEVNFVIGARLDKNNMIEGVIVSPRANVRYTPVKNLILRAGYTSGYRAPQAYDEDLHVMAVGGEASLIVLDPDLRPEYSHSVTASADMYATAGKVQLNLLIEGFYTSLNDVFTLVEKPADAAGNQVLMRTNADRAEVRGVNIEAKAALDANNSLSAGYTFQRSTYRTPVAWSENEAIPAEKSMLRSPDHYGYVSLNTRPVRNFDISLYGTFTGPMLVPHYMPDSADDVLKRTPSFFDLAVKLSYDIRLTRSITLQLNCGVKNAFDAFQNDVDFGALKDSGYIYGPAAPRTFFVGAKFTL